MTTPEHKSLWPCLSPEMRIYYTQLSLLAAVQIIDALSYYYAINLPDAYELNPLINRLAEELGHTGVVTVKVLGAITLVLMTELTRNKLNGGRTSPLINNSLRTINTLYALVCANNASHLFLQK